MGSEPGQKAFIRNIETLHAQQSLREQRVFCRLDLNVPLEGGVIQDANRIVEAIPTIKKLQELGAKVIIASHLGRPKATKKKSDWDPAFSLEPVGAKLAELLQCEVTMADDCIGEGVQLMAQSMKPGSVLLLENLRYYAGEEANDPGFVGELQALCEVYVTDAFGTTHRKHASTFGLAQATIRRGMGYLIERELRALAKLEHNVAQPFWILLGGSKISDKIKTVESLVRTASGIAIGGAMAHSFLMAAGQALAEGAKQPKPEEISTAKRVIDLAKNREIPLLLPVDMNQSFDIGPKTVALFTKALSDARTVFWNGPLGWFEREPYQLGTKAVADHLAQLAACYRVVGGGDTVSAIQHLSNGSKFDHLSTGGGAVLEYLEGNGLPGIDVLKDFSKLPPLEAFEV